MRPAAKLATAVGVSLAWGAAARALACRKASCSPTPMRSSGSALLQSAGEELIFRLPISTQAQRFVGPKYTRRDVDFGLVASAVLFGLGHLQPGETWDRRKLIRFADTTIGGLWYGWLASRWGLEYAIAAHIAHNVTALGMHAAPGKARTVPRRPRKGGPRG